MSSPGEQYLAPFDKVPEINIVLGSNSYILTRQNTVVRMFSKENSEFDHVLVLMDDESVLYFFIDQAGGNDLRQQFDDGDFLIEPNEVLDEDAIEVIVRESRNELFPMPTLE